MYRRALPPHIEMLCHDWHSGDASQILKLGTYQDFDPADVIREIEAKKDHINKSMHIDEEMKERFLGELHRLKRYVMNLVRLELDGGEKK